MELPLLIQGYRIQNGAENSTAQSSALRKSVAASKLREFFEVDQKGSAPSADKRKTPTETARPFDNPAGRLNAKPDSAAARRCERPQWSPASIHL
ncbi:MAG TPA: hypothetical protein DEA50_11610 [Parvularcula sp.]|nr:hypothetical protein [Parvularcula sp.]